MTGQTQNTALVTGAARGIGLAIAHELGAAGNRVVLCDIREEVHDSAQELRSRGLNASAMQLDVGDEQSIRNSIEKFGKEFGRLDILINNAGVSPKHKGYKRLVVDTPLEEWQMVMRINLTGPFLLCREALPLLSRSDSGRIINTVSSVARFASPITGGAYAASKTALIGFSRVLALELAGSRITVNCVAPGRIVTPLSREYDPSVDRDYIPKVPVRRLGQPEDIARAVGFLASRAADAISGTVLDVNGGTFCN
jgi:3-oxoacyl-[acyl-carrier protein] reductase